MALVQTVVDDFSTGTVPNPALWTNSYVPAASVVGGGVLTITPITTGGRYPAVETSAIYTVANSYVMAKVSPAVAQPPSYSVQTYLQVGIDGSNAVAVVTDGRTLRYYVVTASVEAYTDIAAYDATAMAWWRVRHNGTGFLFGYSADGLSWTETGVVVPSWSVTTAMLVTLMCGRWDVADTQTVATFDKLNIIPVPAVWLGAMKRLADPSPLPSSATTVYTVPSGRATQLRSLRVVNDSASSGTFTVSIGADAAGKRLWYGQSVASGDSYDWSGMVALAAGEIIQAYSAGAPLTLSMSGVES